MQGNGQQEFAGKKESEISVAQGRERVVGTRHACKTKRFDPVAIQEDVFTSTLAIFVIMKDRFSERPDNYAVYRPVYPPEMITYILSLVKGHTAYWDVGTGNGQLLSKLAPSFTYAYGTDISAGQLSVAPQLSNTEYKVCAAGEDPGFQHQFDLITVAQAIHWFPFDAFYSIVNQYLNKDGVVVVVGYGLLRFNNELDTLIDEMYEDTLGRWWDPERKYVDEGYRYIPFPFEEKPCPPFTISIPWQPQHLEGFIRTWSAYKLYLKAGHQDPVPAWMEKVNSLWPADEIREVHFPVFLRAGWKKK